MYTIDARSRETGIPMNEDIPIRGENTMLILSKITSTYLICNILDLASFKRCTLTKLDIIFCSISDIEMTMTIRNQQHLRQVRRPIRKVW